jgi:hypothetical protein
MCICGGGKYGMGTMAKVALMVLGTASHVGKSMTVAVNRHIFIKTKRGEI